MADALDQIAVLIHADSRLVGVPGVVGRLELERLAEYPRVVWVSEAGTIGPPDDVGGRMNTAPAGRSRQVYTDTMAVQLHIWAADREAARDIMHALLAACWVQARGAVAFGGYRWITEETARGEFATHGAGLLLTATFQLPVFEQDKVLTTIRTQRHRGDYVDDATGTTITGICQT